MVIAATGEAHFLKESSCSGVMLALFGLLFPLFLEASCFGAASPVAVRTNACNVLARLFVRGLAVSVVARRDKGHGFRT